MTSNYNEYFVQEAYLEVLFHQFPLEIIREVPFLRVKISDQEYYLGHGGFYPIENLIGYNYDDDEGG